MTHDDSETRQAAAQNAGSSEQADPGTATRRTFLKTTAVGAAGMAAGSASVASAHGDGDDHDHDHDLNALALDLSNLPSLGGDAYYEGWAIYPPTDDAEDAEPEKISTGVFSKGEEYVFSSDYNLAGAMKIAITIEPDDQPGGEPSGIVALAGEIEEDEADLSFPVDFSEASGSYLLNTPTAPDADGESGLWFLEAPADAGHRASLDLPELPGGWTYEGWAVEQGVPLTTGRFDDPTMADDAAPYSGLEDAPSFPGEDFVTNLPDGVEAPVDLADGESKAVISVEPDLDGDDPTGDGPFQIKPLAGEIPEHADPGDRLDLPRNDGTLPSGTATLHRNVDAARGHEDQQNAVSFDFSMLPDLGDDAYYEGWAVDDDGAVPEKVSTGVFSKGQEYVFGVDRDLSQFSEVVVTVEPDDEPGGEPSGIVALSGYLSEGEADLSFPVDFSEASGSYLLNTPTAPDAAPQSGLWFLEPNPDGEGHVASLDVPELPDGWVYEGWAVEQGTPLTTGRFDDPTMADDAAPYSGLEDAPSFPGEDFVTNLPDGVEAPVDLADGESKAVLSVEPDLDGDDPTGSGPFQIKPLVADVPEDAEGGTNFDLGQNGGTTPSGTATLYDDVEAATDPGEGEQNGLALDLSNLPELGDDAYYEGWAIYPPTPEAGDEPEKVSTGVFSKGDEYAFEADRDLGAAEKVAITIEPDDQPGGEPSGIVALAGELSDGEAALSFPVDLSGASGSYILASPTTVYEAETTEGIWFLQSGSDGGLEASLDLPELPDGWTYEGWGVTQGVPLTTGRFDDPTTADDSAPYSGTDGALPFPGEDFLQNLPDGVEETVDLADGESKAVVSVEPDLDGEDPTGDAPFQVKPLVAEIPEDAVTSTSYDFEHNAGTTPSGTATLHDDLEAAKEAIDEYPMELEFELSNLPELGDDAFYEGWAIYRGEAGSDKVSTGLLPEDGDYTQAVGEGLSDADEIAITIEPDDEPGGEPSGVVVLHGELTPAGVADLSFPASFDDAAGSYLLNTPTTGDLVAGESGVWFLQPDGEGGHEAALDLPELGDGWTYEGWVVHEGTPITTGRFDDPTVADDAAPYSGTQEGPSFPGEDLITNEPTDDLLFPTDLTDGESKVVVSVEPDLDGEDPTGAAPFQVKPLAGEIPADAEVGTNYDLGQTEGTLPSGTAFVETEAMSATVGDGHVVHDLDGDGNYRDVNGDGSVSNGDVTTFFGNQHTQEWDERTDLFDFDGNGDVGQADVVDLFEYVND